MLQACEYKPLPYLAWVWRTRDYSKVQHRQKLDRTSYAKALLTIIYVGITVEILVGILMIVFGLADHIAGLWPFGAALIVIYPIIWPHLILIPLLLGDTYIVKPRQDKQILTSAKIFAKHPGVKIAVAGSYGKTSMKEVLKIVLEADKKVVATLANHNVPIEHAKLARNLDGQEDVLIIEYGEGEPGDVVKFCQVTHPNYGIITGLAPAHLDKYKILKAAGDDIFSLATYLKNQHVYVNSESVAVKEYIKPQFIQYDEHGAGKLKVENLKISITSTKFKLVTDKQTINVNSGLIGRHQVGVLSVAVLIALELGLSVKQIENAIAKTKPFEHRMQPYELSGAWIIDDTYNGNIDGIKVGCQLLAELKAKRKIYVTPGLVDQGSENAAIHNQLGRYIASSNPDLVVLMNNSVTLFIKEGLIGAGYKGELRIETNPLNFYLNLEHFVASGDLVLMQNDWPDHYH